MVSRDPRVHDAVRAFCASIGPWAMILAATVGAACSSSSAPVDAEDAAPDRAVAADGSGDSRVLVDGGVDGHAQPDGASDGSCGPASTAGFKPPAYVPSVAHQGACTSAEIADFVSACITSTSGAPCEAWQLMNLGDGGATPCGDCIFAPDDNGGVWVDPGGGFFPNVAGCMQLEDPTNGPACAAAYNIISACNGVACDSRCLGKGVCSELAECNDCITASNEGSCNAYAISVGKDCAADYADGGALDLCSPGWAMGEQAPTYSLVIGLICGSAPADAGSGG